MVSFMLSHIIHFELQTEILQYIFTIYYKVHRNKCLNSKKKKKNGGFGLTFQKRFVNFLKEINHKTDFKCRPPWLSKKENFSL